MGLLLHSTAAARPSSALDGGKDHPKQGCQTDRSHISLELELEGSGQLQHKKEEQWWSSCYPWRLQHSCHQDEQGLEQNPAPFPGGCPMASCPSPPTVVHREPQLSSPRWWLGLRATRANPGQPWGSWTHVDPTRHFPGRKLGWGIGGLFQSAKAQSVGKIGLRSSCK